MLIRKVPLFLLSFLSLAEILPAQVQFNIIQRMMDSVSAERVMSHVDQLQRAGGHWSRANFTPGLDSAVMYVQRAFNSMPGISSVRLDTFFVLSAQSPFNTRPMFNVVATIQGMNPSGGKIVIGAHIDACGNRSPGWDQQWDSMRVPGADDNASGVAAVLELAHLMSNTAMGFNAVNTIDFVAFGFEETGPAYTGFLYGSGQYALRAKTNGENIIGMASLDMIGFNDLNNMYLNIAADDRSRWLGEHIVAMNNSFHLGITLNAPPFAYGRWSDHASFWDQQFTAVCLIECAPPWTGNPYYNANPFYHSSSDTLGTLNPQLLKKGTQLTLASFASLGSSASSIATQRKNIPNEFVLEQNYPNPFNPSTEICFRIPVSGFTLLNVFDALGREVTVLVHEAKQAGRHTVRFDGNGLPSGIYLYRLTNGGRLITKKMILLK
ncbi:MAG: M28 family peptidase [Ignavibacteriales bacterium]|nr:M28 family peptidase [Ignavibacteriales bacterium]